MTDSLSLAQYRDIYATVRGGRTLRGVVSTLKPHGCTLSIAAWSKIERDLLGLNLEARNALRRHAGLPDVPPTPAEIVTNAGVERVMVASDEPDTAVLVGPEVHQVNLRTNGKDRTADMLPEVLVTPVTLTKRHRKPRTGITVCTSVGDPLKQLKIERGQTWDECLRKLREDSIRLEVLQSQPGQNSAQEVGKC